MKSDESILALGSSPELALLADRARSMGYRVTAAKTVDAALALAEERGMRFGGALIEPEIPAVVLGDALDAIRDRSRSPLRSFIAVGRAPRASSRELLRDAGVSLALWAPASDHALRFQLNRAISDTSGAPLRGEVRVPTEWRAKVFTGGRQKDAAVYSLSGGGVFLATKRPSMRGSALAIELELPRGRIEVAGRVLYTNVPGNLQRRSLPSGMAVSFVDVLPATRTLLRDSVSNTAAHYIV